MLDLPRHLGAESIARRELGRWFGGRSSDIIVEDLQQVASELVTNAVVHGVGNITLEAHSTRDNASMEIRDEGDGFAVSDVKRQGSGLAIVHEICEQWGVSPGATHVWCEFGRGFREAADHKEALNRWHRSSTRPISPSSWTP
jgi:hypothetical protein